MLRFPLSSMQSLRQGLGMMLVALEQRKAPLQQRLQLGILRVGNKRLAQGLIDRLMIRHFVVDIFLVERCPIETSKLLRSTSAACFRLWLVGLSSGVTFSF